MSWTAFIREPRFRRNRFARDQNFSSLLLRCFRSDILPARQDRPRVFEVAEIFGELYQYEREWIDATEPSAPGERDAHEQYLDKLFWDEGIGKKSLCVLGTVGCGKSTLVDYYLRCYCPHNGAKAAEFARKLVLFLDTRDLHDEVAAMQNFHKMCQDAIRQQCNERHIDINALVHRHGATKNVQEWVQAAMEEISTIAGNASNDAPFRYIVVVLDNLDQLPVRIQKKLINTIEFWSQLPSLKMWRVIIPLWPSTYSKLQRNYFNFLRGVPTFLIGPPTEAELIHKRARGLLQEARKLQVTPDKASAESDLSRYLQYMIPLIERRLGVRIRHLTHGNLRSELCLWEGILASDSAYAVWSIIQNNPSTKRLFDYDLMDAMISGGYECLSPDAQIANIFSMGERNVAAHDLLVGYHALHCLHIGNDSVRDWYVTLQELGYSQTTLDHVQDRLRYYNVVHQTPSAEPYGVGFDFVTHREVIEAYRNLIQHPAYIDNVALITPVDEDTRTLLHRTSPHDSAQFTARVDSSLAFITFVSHHEDAFCAYLTGHNGATRARAAELKIPRVSRLMAASYFDRVSALCHEPEFSNVEDSWWSRTLGDLTRLMSADEFIFCG